MSPSSRPRVLAVIAGGDRPHLVAAAPSPPQSRSAPPRVPLDDALVICLTMLDDDPPLFQRAATAWHARWCTHLPTLTLAEAQITLGALEALAGPDPIGGARALRWQSAQHGLFDVVEVLDSWIAQRQATALTSGAPA